MSTNLRAQTLTRPTNTLALADVDDWRELAACRGEDPEMFFREGASAEAAAKAVCRRCPVSTQCLMDAIKNDERFGVWGGVRRG